MMMSRKFLIAASAAAFALLAVHARAAGVTVPVPALKAEVTVTGETIRLGDLLENAGEAAAIPVFHAPGLGASGTIQVHRVIEAARQNGVPVFDTRGLNEVMILRAARTIALSDLEQAVADAATRHLGLGDAADISVRFDRDVRALQVEPDARGTPRIVRFAYDNHSGRFDGIVELQGSFALRKVPVRLTGTLVETAEIVVIARNIARGESLRESDVLVERRPRADVPPDAQSRLASVIGQAARRALRAGQPLRPADLMKPDLVGRNDTVTIVFEVPGITLTARGKALASGAEGESIEVLNPHSKRVLHATVSGTGTVTVGRGRTVTADAAGKVQ
jgi:flagella basal body P-ring formation protein FlgA